MIELHSHILPGIDDGPHSMEESIEMARIYESAGFRTVVATPHFMPGTSWTPAVRTIEERVRQLNGILKKEAISVRVLSGMEIAMDSAVLRLMEERRLLTLAGSSYILLETPFQTLPLGWDNLVFDFNKKGYGILLAHPERCAQLMNRPAMIHKMLQAGCHVQVNWSSLMGRHGRQTADFAWHLIKKGWLHCLATDSHDTHLRQAGLVERGMEKLRSIAGERNTSILVVDNPGHVIRSESLEEMSVAKEDSGRRSRGWFRSLF